MNTETWELNKIHQVLEKIEHLFKRLVGLLDRTPVKIKFYFEGEKVANPISKLVGQTVNCSVPVETNAEGVNLPIVVANINWTSDNAAVSGPITKNADGSASFVGQSAGVANISVTDSAFPGLTDTGACTESADNTPAKIAFSFS